MPCYGAHDDTFMVPYPPDARDTLLVSQLSHSVTNYRPVYPGDTLYLVADGAGSSTAPLRRAPSTGTSLWTPRAPSTTSGARRSTTPPGASPRA